jgi:hypothetical protein
MVTAERKVLMKITLHPDGSVEFNGATVEEALALAQQIQRNEPASNTSNEAPRTPREWASWCLVNSL